MTSKKDKMTSPFGVAGFCSLHRPSTKFKKDGEYSAQVILPEGPETDAFIADLDARFEAAYRANLIEAQADLNTKAAKAGKQARQLEEIKRASKPYKRNVDPDTGENLPGWIVTARLGATVRDGKDGPVLYTRKPIIVDAKNQPVFQPVGSGSTIRIQFTAGGFFTEIGSGLSLKLIGVQVQKLAAMGVGTTDFEDVEGFEEAAAKASDPVETTHAPVEGAAPESTEGVVPQW